MAGDWIKMRVDLQDDPAVVAICDTLELDEFQVIGRLHKLWGWADKHTADGVTSGVTPKWVDRYVNQMGFAEALICVGWLEFSDEVLKFPGFDIHNGRSAKSRCDASIRQRVSRSRHVGVTNGGDKRVPVPRPFVRAVFARDNYTCVYCGTESDEGREASKKSLLSIDHIIPHSRGNGRQAIEDLATCCKLCNGEKNDRTPEEWGILPTFLADGVSYDGHNLVTKKCDTNVTAALPREEKNREEKKNTHTHSQPARDSISVPEELAVCWARWCDYSELIGKPVNPIQADAMLMDLGRRGTEKAIRDIDFSIRKSAKSILDSDNDFQKQASQPRSYAPATRTRNYT